MYVRRFEDVIAPYQQVEDGITINRHNHALSAELHTHDYYEIVYVFDGEGIHIINNKPYAVQAGSLMVLKPGDMHIYHSLTDMSLFHCCFTSQEPLSHLSTQYEFPVVITLDNFFKLQLELLFYMLEEELKQRKAHFYQAAWSLLDFIIFIIFRRIVEPPSIPSVWTDVLSYITANLKDAEFSEAVKIFGTSDSYFCRMFKRDFSMTFRKFLIKLRIQKAKELLQSTNKSVSEIYELCGYNNNRTFFLDFKKIVGMTPSQYRKEHQGDQSDTYDMEHFLQNATLVS